MKYTYNLMIKHFFLIGLLLSITWAHPHHQHHQHNQQAHHHEHQGHDHEHQHDHDHGHEHQHEHGHQHEHQHEHKQEHGDVHEHEHDCKGHSHEHSHEHDHIHVHEDPNHLHPEEQHSHQNSTVASNLWSKDDLYVYGLCSGALVSSIGFVAAIFLLFLQKLMKPSSYGIIIQFLFALSCGALLGETMLHILPEAYQSPLMSTQDVSLTFIAAIIAFLLLQRAMEAVGVSDSHWHDEDGSSSQLTENHNVRQKRELEGKKGKQLPHLKVEKHSTGYLNLISSLLHNFIDGATIGIAFSLGNPREFIPITLGIIAHEIPREMGDVAILLKSNFSAKQTILSNSIVNLISLVGVWLGLNSHDIPDTLKQYILVFVAGNFLYIAADIWKHLFTSKKKIAKFLEMAGLLIGVFLSVYSGHDHSHGHGHGHSHGHDHSHHHHH